MLSSCSTPSAVKISSSASTCSTSVATGSPSGAGLREIVSTLPVGAIALLAPALAHLKLERLQRWLEPRRPPRPLGGPEASSVIEAIERRVERLERRAKPFVRSDCLPRGITRYYFLRRAGIDVALCFGIRPLHEDPVLGHCWLALDGASILETRDPRPLYTEVARLSRRGITYPPDAEHQNG
jgi:Transglutaminase-like superfamily